ncbi:MAG TPA: bifunctional SulP family inorganic anion transporter/carbonic anhydrase [Planctomycetia bacterium]|nr:bifunctional SulP family inorganic anion transporter/carbonic anhydrase [Planctomycetia bacterium]
MNSQNGSTGPALVKDLTAGLVVFLVALPLCLGIALASSAPGVDPALNVPLFSGLLAGIVGGLVVGLISGSQTSVSGPAAGLTAVVAAQIASLGSFQTFLLAVVIAGVIQIGLGIARAGILAAFIPSSVIKGLLAAIGVIIILKQIPHVIGHDKDPEGDFAFFQSDSENTFTELIRMVGGFQWGAAIVGLGAVALLVVWDKVKFLKKSPLPAPLVAVLLGVALSALFKRLGEPWAIDGTHLVQVPVASDVAGFFKFLTLPDFTQILNPKVLVAGFTIAAVASLETLLNLEAVDKIDPQQRNSPPSRELLAQGFGNIASGMIGGLPVTSVIVRSSVNINAGGRTKFSAIFHGILLFVSVVFLPAWLNLIPLSCLAAILLVTGFKLASPALFRRMWSEGRYQFLPFVVTVSAIVLTDLLIGVLIGLGVSLGFILWSNVKRPVRQIIEKHLGGDVVRIELANQVSFLNRVALGDALSRVPRGGHVLLDATNTDYIDPDVLDLIRDFAETGAPAHGVEVSLRGFQDHYELHDQTLYADYSTRELQAAIAPAQVLKILKDGNERFRTGRRLTRDFGRLLVATAEKEHPLAVVLSCIDSRSPAELILDLGVGDIYSVRVAGPVLGPSVIGSIEYGCAVAGAKLVLVLGHTRCGAVAASVDFAHAPNEICAATGCHHLDPIVEVIQQSVDPTYLRPGMTIPEGQYPVIVDAVARRNVGVTVKRLLEASATMRALVEEGKIAIVGAMYDVSTGAMEFLSDEHGAAHAAIDGAPSVIRRALRPED